MENVKEESIYVSLSQNVQAMTIKRISVKSLDRDYRLAKGPERLHTTSTLQDLAVYAVESYNTNDALKRTSGETEDTMGNEHRNGEENNPFNSVFKPITLSENWVKHATDNGFSLIGFYCDVEIKRAIDSILQKAGAIIPKPREVSHIFVFCRDSGVDKCMYTLTAGTRGYVPFQRYTDYHFPRKIALRLLDLNKIFLADSKHVTGNIIWSRIASRGTPLYDPSDTFKVFTSFRAPLRPNSSIFSISQFPFKPRKNGTSKELTEFEIKQGGIRIEKCLPFNSYSHILDHFENIYNKEKTYEHVTGKQEIDSDASFRHLFYFTYVEDNMTINELKKLLVSQLIKCFTEPDNHETWDVCHPKLEDYFKSSTFCLKYRYRKKSYKREIPKRLSFGGLRKALIKFDKEAHCYRSALPNVIQNVKLGFRFRGEWMFAPILDCLMGQLEVVDHNGDTKTYSKLNKSWYEVDEYLLKTVDGEFQECMKACMVFEDDEGFLPDPWVFSKPTFTEISKKLKITADETKALCNTTFSYVNESDGNKVMCSLLAGEILLNLDVKSYSKDIQKLLQKPTLQKEELNKILKQEDKCCEDSIWSELVKPRTVGQINSKKAEGVLIRSPYYPNGTDEQREVLVRLANRSIWTKHEAKYNEGYLYTRRRQREEEQPQPYRLEDGSGYLLGDRICPQGIELFDILYFTENKTYLYHVKDGFNQSTRDACSQIMNSATLLQGALQNQCAILDEFYDKVMSTKVESTGYRSLAKLQMETFGKENFKKLFKKGKANIVFVYAFLDDRSDGYCELTPKMVENKHLNPSDFAFDDSEKSGQRLFDELVSQGYLDKDGRRDKKFFTISKEDQLSFANSDFQKYRSKVWKTLNGGLGNFASLIARLEVLHTRARLRNMGFDFKICQIKQPESPARLSRCRPGIFTVKDDQSEVTTLVYDRNEGGELTRIGFHVPVHQRVQGKSYSAFRALFGDVCRSESEEREKFLTLLKAQLESQTKDQLLFKLLGENTKFLILEAIWRKDDSSEIGSDIKRKERLLLSYDSNNAAAKEVARLRNSAEKIKQLLNKLIKAAVRKKTLLTYIKTELGIDTKTKADITDWLEKHYMWSAKIISSLWKEFQNGKLTCNIGKKLKTEFEEFSRLLRDMDDINEILEDKTFPAKTLAYFQGELPFTSYELELLAYVNSLHVEIIRLGSNPMTYECINSAIFHQCRELIVVRENDMVYERCVLGDTPGAFKSTAVVQLD